MEITETWTILGLVLFSLMARATFALDIANSSTEVCFPGNINNNNLRLNGLKGSFQSSERPLVNSSCDWLITVPEGKIIKLVFGRFSLDYDRSPWGCPRDFLEIYDGNSSSSERRGRFCGLVKPMNIYSTDRYILVRLRTDNESSLWNPGFTATFTAEETYGMLEYNISREVR